MFADLTNTLSAEPIEVDVVNFDFVKRCLSAAMVLLDESGEDALELRQSTDGRVADLLEQLADFVLPELEIKIGFVQDCVELVPVLIELVKLCNRLLSHVII